MKYSTCNNNAHVILDGWALHIMHSKAFSINIMEEVADQIGRVPLIS